MVKICNIVKQSRTVLILVLNKMSHMGGDVSSYVQSKCKYNSLMSVSCADRFVHKNRFQPLFACDIESNIESKCQNDDSTCASEENKSGVLPVLLSVKDGNKRVRGN